MDKISIRALMGALALVCSTAHAWGQLGHHTVGAIADGMLNGKAKAEVAALLAGDLNKDCVFHAIADTVPL